MFFRNHPPHASMWARPMVPARKACSHQSTWASSASSRMSCWDPSGATRMTRLLTMLAIQTPTFTIKGKTVREGAFPEGGHGLPVAERAVRSDAEPRQSPAEGFVDVKPGAVRAYDGLIGVPQVVGHDARAALVLEHDEAVGDVRPVRPCARVQSRAHGHPDPAQAILGDEIGRRQFNTVDFLQKRPDGPVAAEFEDTALGFAEVGQKKSPAAPQGDAVGPQGAPAGEAAGIKGLRSVRPDVGDTAAPVGGKEVARGCSQDALRPHQPVSLPC